MHSDVRALFVLGDPPGARYANGAGLRPGGEWLCLQAQIPSQPPEALGGPEGAESINVSNFLASV